MRDFLLQLAGGTWGAALQMAPYLLFGFLMAGLLSVWIRPELVERHLGGQGLWPVIKAALFGVPMPLCSCGVIPVAASLRKHGASRGATVAFLMSTPQTGLDNVLVVYSLLGPVVAVFSPITALVSGILAGLLVNAWGGPKTEPADAPVRAVCTDDCCQPAARRNKLVRALHYGFVVLPRDLVRPLLLGLFAAGVIAALVPEGFFSGSLGRGLPAMFAMMLVGIPLYVCATASVPIAAALVAKGVSPGAAIVFLIVGPATNAATIATIWRMLGRRVAFLYLATVAGTALAAGLALDHVLLRLGPAAHHAGHDMLPEWWRVSCVAGLGLMLGAALVEPAWLRRLFVRRAGRGAALDLRVAGMTCPSCERSVVRAALACRGVIAAEADRRTGQLRLEGTNVDADQVIAALAEIGFEATRNGLIQGDGAGK
jgi:uncharacterized membrane protein YraQ (UPF0718 family)/copper chaperone CopZ